MLKSATNERRLEFEVGTEGAGKFSGANQYSPYRPFTESNNFSES